MLHGLKSHHMFWIERVEAEQTRRLFLYNSRAHLRHALVSNAVRAVVRCPRTSARVVTATKTMFLHTRRRFGAQKHKFGFHEKTTCFVTRFRAAARATPRDVFCTRSSLPRTTNAFYALSNRFGARAPSSPPPRRRPRYLLPPLGAPCPRTSQSVIALRFPGFKRSWAARLGSVAHEQRVVGHGGGTGAAGSGGAVVGAGAAVLSFDR